MTPTRLDERVRACFLTGFVPAILAPVLWPIVISLMAEPTRTAGTNSGDVLFMFITVSGFALVIGMLACLLIGIPTLSVADKVGINNPIVMSIAGAAFSLSLFVGASFATDAESVSLLEIWPLYSFFAVIGAVCGASASALSRRRKSQKS